jgi:hypothetical protein
MLKTVKVIYFEEMGVVSCQATASDISLGLALTLLEAET